MRHQKLFSPTQNVFCTQIHGHLFCQFFVSFSNVLTFFFIVRSITATSMSKAWPSWVFKKQTRQPIFFKETFLFVSYAIIHYNTLLSLFLKWKQKNQLNKASSVKSSSILNRTTTISIVTQFHRKFKIKHFSSPLYTACV